MASLCRQIFRVNACRNLILSTARRGYADKMMSDPMEHATGLEKKELLALQAGNDDPFNMKMLKKAAGTREDPTLVPSCFDARIESVAGLFLVYSLMHLQPYKNFASLRLVPEDIPAIQRIESVARREKRYDVLYILASVLIKGPCQFHAAERERGMEPAIKKYLDGFKSIDSVRGVRSKGVFYRQTEELDLIRELGVITKKYSETKAQVMDDENVKTEREHVNSVEEIKMKAMKEAVNPVKHLTGIVDRKQLKKSKKEKQIKIDDKESETFNIDKKRRPSPNGNKNKKHKVNEDEANVKSEEAEIELHISYSDRSESSESDNENTENVESTVKSLPMLINDNVGAYEIEIIDESQSNEVTEQSVLPNSSTVDVNIPTVPLTKVKKEKITKNISKKSHLKSRLSRLGMLKVASLDKN
ncbi:Cytochrome c oxidase subunit 5B, mitochondrial [Papilio machaon]|uniref:Cytochrome c oxidase subunit 5B, mitochondrial n=1 Tax=Papilio machaon TaxID=76193 RepID=A0A194QW09_PAPMA|nr:Cytochrome c oxidase subunit 5B, mitochondrial [Papilio machaon]